jgi:hypothetical protein
MTGKRLWPEALDRIEGIKPGSHVFRSCDEEAVRWFIRCEPSSPRTRRRGRDSPRVVAPLYAQDFVKVAGVCPVKDEWGKLAGQVRRRIPDLDMIAVGYEDVACS